MLVDMNIQDGYSTVEAAEFLNIGYATLYRWIKSGKIKAIKLGGRTLIPASEIDRFQDGEVWYEPKT